MLFFVIVTDEITTSCTICPSNWRVSIFRVVVNLNMFNPRLKKMQPQAYQSTCRIAPGIH